MAAFATLKPYQMTYLATAGIGDMFIMPAEIEECKRVLNLSGDMTEGELRAMRNAVVRYTSNLKANYRNEETGEIYDAETYFAIHNNMSGITAVIDNILWHKGCEV